MSEDREQRVKDFLASYKALCVRHGLHIDTEQYLNSCTLKVHLLGERDLDDLTDIGISEYWL